MIRTEYDRKRRAKEFIVKWEQIQSAARVVTREGGGKIKITKKESAEDGKNTKIKN